MAFGGCAFCHEFVYMCALYNTYYTYTLYLICHICLRQGRIPSRQFWMSTLNIRTWHILIVDPAYFNMYTQYRYLYTRYVRGLRGWTRRFGNGLWDLCPVDRWRHLTTADAVDVLVYRRLRVRRVGTRARARSYILFIYCYYAFVCHDGRDGRSH